MSDTRHFLRSEVDTRGTLAHNRLLIIPSLLLLCYAHQTLIEINHPIFRINRYVCCTKLCVLLCWNSIYGFSCAIRTKWNKIDEITLTVWTALFTENFISLPKHSVSLSAPLRHFVRENLCSNRISLPWCVMRSSCTTCTFGRAQARLHAVFGWIFGNGIFILRWPNFELIAALVQFESWWW